MSLSGTSTHSSAHSFHEDVLRELGYYDESEDLSQWSFERRFADDQWNESNLTLLGSRDNFTGRTPGRTAVHDGLLFPEVEYFLKFWLPHVLQRIVEETNRYAEQEDHDEPHLTNGRADWVDITVPELKCWLGILILMGLKPLPHRRLYWDRSPYYGCPIISVAMQRARFEAIVRCVHLVNNEALVTDEAAEGYDKIAKVRWLIEEFARISQSLYNAERTCTVDEIMVPYKGRYCAIRQDMY